MMHARGRDERGATLVEVGIVLPLLILLAIGLAEIGFAVIDFITVSNAARAGARTGAAAADTIGADDAILEVVEEDACNLHFGELVRVFIFEADTDGSMPDVSTGLVNEYTNAGSLNCGVDGHSLSCANGCPWAEGSASRNNVPDTANPDSIDEIGVTVEFTHDAVTGLFPFPSTVNWTESAVMQLEPDTRG